MADSHCSCADATGYCDDGQLAPPIFRPQRPPAVAGDAAVNKKVNRLFNVHRLRTRKNNDLPPWFPGFDR